MVSKKAKNPPSKKSETKKGESKKSDGKKNEGKKGENKKGESKKVEIDVDGAAKDPIETSKDHGADDSGDEDKNPMSKLTFVPSQSRYNIALYNHIVEAVLRGNALERAEAFDCLANMNGLDPLLQRFSVLIVEGVRIGVLKEDIRSLLIFMRLINALVKNEKTQIERILTSLLPMIVSAMVNRVTTDEAWELREYCGQLLYKITLRINDCRIKMSIIKVLVSGLTRDGIHAPMIYSIVYTFNLLGPRVLETFVFSRLDAIAAFIKLHNGDDSAARLHQIITKYIIDYKNTDRGRRLAPKFFVAMRQFT